MIQAFLLASLAQNSSVAISSGLPGPGDLPFVGIHDSFIEQSSPHENFGQDRLLSGGPGKFVFIRFDEVGRVLGIDRMVSNATLKITRELGRETPLKAVYTVSKPWFEGPGRRGLKLFTPKVDANEESPTYAVTWARAIGGKAGMNWQNPGGQGPADRQLLSGWNANWLDGSLIVDLPSGTVQSWADRPWDNHGLCLEFGENVDFSSSESPFASSRPKLLIVHSPKMRTMDARPDLGVESLSFAASDQPAWPSAGEVGEWSAVVVNRGEIGSGPAELEWELMGKTLGKSVVPPIEPGQSATLAFKVPFSAVPSGDPRFESLTARLLVSGREHNESDNLKTTWLRALPLQVVVDQDSLKESGQSLSDLVRQFNSAADYLNQAVMDQSRFSFALSGTAARIRLESLVPVDLKTVRLKAGTSVLTLGSETMTDADAVQKILGFLMPQSPGPQDSPRLIDPYSGLSGVGDTRDDSDVPTVLGTVREPWPDPQLDFLPFFPTGLLGSHESGYFQLRTSDPAFSVAGMKPKRLVFRCLDALGMPVADGSITGPNGMNLAVKEGVSAPLDPATLSYSNELILTTPNGQAPAILKSWQWQEAFSRGNKDSALLSVRFNIAPFSVSKDVNFAQGRIIIGQGNVPADQLAKLVDGDTSTGISLKESDGSIEIELGKDRSVGLVELVLKRPVLWGRFNILTVQTGQEQGMRWASETKGTASLIYRSSVEGGNYVFPIYGQPARARRIILAPQPGERPLPIDIQEIRVYGTVGGN